MINNPTDGAVIAPRQKHVERQGGKSEPYVQHWYDVRGGICEFCGVIDPKQPSEYQYKLCPHYRGMDLRCSYCDEMRNPDEVNRTNVLHVTEHPDNPDKLIICCDNFSCCQKHQARFQRN